MWKRVSDWFGLAYPADTPEAKENREVRVDYTRAPEPQNEEFNWVATTEGVVVSSEPVAEMLRLISHDESNPFGYGTVEIHKNWLALWDVAKTNMAVHALVKLLKKETREQGWKYDGLVSSGVELEAEPTERTAAVEGIGERNPGLMDWRTTDGDGNWGQDVEQVDYYGIENPTDGVGMCPDCSVPFPNYEAWVRHRVEHEVQPQTDETSDDVFPANQVQMTPTHKMEVMGRVAKQLIDGPIPFLFDVENDHIYAGHPGERHSDIKGRFAPGGVVRGFYMPNGEMQIRNETDMSYTLYGMTRLWYYLYPELRIKSIKAWVNGNLVKMASKSIAHRVINMAHTDVSTHTAMETLIPHGDVFVVGGAIRDVILEKSPKDYDLLVSGVDPDTVVDLLRHVGRVGFHGKSFGIFGFSDPNGGQVEIALPRTERSTGSGRRDFEIVSDHTLPIERDLARRDFSVNSIAVNVRTGELIDPYGGIEDLQMGTFSLINDRAFEEDPTRLMRGLTLISKHGLDPDPQTALKMREGAAQLVHATAESIGMELDKILAGQNPGKALRFAMDNGLLEHWLPEIQKLNGFDQKNKHHSRKLDDHTLTVLSNMVERTGDVDLRWAALLHDVGKPDSQWFDEDGWAHYYHNRETGQGADHAEVGEEITRRILRRLRFSNERINRIARLVGMHMFPVFTKASGARKFLSKADTLAMDLMHLRWADAGGKDFDFSPQTQLMQQLVESELERAGALTVKDLAVSGRDLMEVGFEPGAKMGRTLDALLTEVLENQALNNREDLLRIAKAALHE